MTGSAFAAAVKSKPPIIMAAMNNTAAAEL
jgi:hypothetical protein